VVTPAARREAVAHLQQGYEMSERRACSLLGADRSSVRYRHRRPDDRELREVLRVAAESHRRFGYRRLHVLLRRDGHVLNRKRTQRLYLEEGFCAAASESQAGDWNTGAAGDRSHGKRPLVGRLRSGSVC
jgi:putative transposase